MPIYDRPVKELMREFAKDRIRDGRTFEKSEAVSWFQDRYPRIKASTVKAHVEAMAVNAFGWRKNDPALRPGGGYDLFYKAAPGTFRLWVPETDPPPIYHDGIAKTGPSEPIDGSLTVVATSEVLARTRKNRIDMSIAREFGDGAEIVYAYGYHAAPGYFKIGRCDGDVEKRISSQIDTGTPGQPVLHLIIRTNDSRNLEKALHRVLRVRNRGHGGGGEEWFKTSLEEVIQIYQFCIGDTGSLP
jgi:hypothetical protein